MSARFAIYSTLRHHPWGAPDILWLRAAEEALRRGHRVFAVVRPQITGHPAVVALRRAGAEIALVPAVGHHGGAQRLSARLRNLRSGAFRTLHRLRRFRPTLLVLNQGGFYDFLSETELLSLLRADPVPYAVLAHSNYEMPALTDHARLQARDFIGRARIFLGVSRYVLELAERQLLGRIENAAVFQNPVELPACLPLPWPSEDTANFATVSRLDAHGKGLDILLPALREALGTTATWRLNVYGDGPDRSYLEQLARWCSLADRVVFHGYEADKGRIWAGNHLLLLPSRFEGCSYSMVEALLCGRPVLRTAYGGVAEWMRDGVTGFLCPAAEPDLLARALRTAWTRQAEWAAMGRAAHAHARARCDPHPERVLLNLLEA